MGGSEGKKRRKTSKNDELTVTECEIKLLFVIIVSDDTSRPS